METLCYNQLLVWLGFHLQNLGSSFYQISQELIASSSVLLMEFSLNVLVDNKHSNKSTIEWLKKGKIKMFHSPCQASA